MRNLCGSPGSDTFNDEGGRAACRQHGGDLNMCRMVGVAFQWEAMGKLASFETWVAGFMHSVLTCVYRMYHAWTHSRTYARWDKNSDRFRGVKRRGVGKQYPDRPCGAGVSEWGCVSG